uniref:Uncharacterized protein n=1 Tax=Arundo donax TaxID=35708 RepID=A0A0A8Y8S8_ARUDO
MAKVALNPAINVRETRPTGHATCLRLSTSHSRPLRAVRWRKLNPAVFRRSSSSPSILPTCPIPWLVSERRKRKGLSYDACLFLHFARRRRHGRRKVIDNHGGN